MQSILSKEISIKVYDLIFVHAMFYLIYKIIDTMGGLEGVVKTFASLKLF
jgi:hypothetical protein